MSSPSITSTASLLSACRKLVCVGRNYAAHAKELGNAVPSKPVLFLKPSTSLLSPSQGPILCPEEVTSLHHEVELGIVIGKKGVDIPISSVSSHVCGYVLALDMTARNLQDEAKKGGLPWSVAKGYDTFCPISDFLPASLFPSHLLSSPDQGGQPPPAVELWCKVDQIEKQRGSTSLMLFNIPYLISYISNIFTLEVGDIILTGTPEGVGPVSIGQTLTCGIVGLEDSGAKITVQVARRQSKSHL